MKIIDIEAIPIHPRLASRYDNLAGRVRMSGIDCRMVFKVKTDNGIVGYGDYDWPGPPPPNSMFEPLIDRNPFDFLLNRLNMGLGSALYDVMGKYLEVPVYKLLGQKVRDAGTVAAWTRPCPPDVFAQEVKRSMDEGYMVFKMHTNARWDPVEQAKAAMDMNPPKGFKIHYDFNHGQRTVGTLMPLIEMLERECPIVGFIEDPMMRSDVDGWRTLRQKSKIAIVHGGDPIMGGFQEILAGMADAYMLVGSTSIASIMAQGTLCARANVQTILQLTGGTLMKAMTLHLAAVLPTATGHSINLDDQYEEDITTKRFEVTEGFSRVPEGSGLGFDVDEVAIKRMSQQEPLQPPKTVGILHLPGGKKIYSTRYPAVQRITGREEGDIRGINFQYWEDDGSPEFAKAYAEAEKTQ
ncbi:MAG: hypothetical protein FJ319_12105 [SAR202 cluster bacterium]|nr:hypothetical protein [SAR202 cluster bacterium]